MAKILVKCNKCHKYGTVWVEKIPDLKAIMQSKGWRVADECKKVSTVAESVRITLR